MKPPIAILAGGLATRLLPVTEKIPKSMVPVHGRPFLQYQLDLLREQGFRRIVICAGHLGEQIRTHFGDRLEYSFDGGTLLGTAGAIRQALPLLGDTFFVMYGDSYLPTDFGAVLNGFVFSGTPVLMTVFHNQDARDRSNVWFEGGQIRLYDKTNPIPRMEHIDYGLSVFRAKAFDGVETELGDIFRSHLLINRLAAFEVKEPFYEIGSPGGLAEFTRDFQ